ncbi:balbiani ring protein 3-like [Pollicipes pollicipes]|uniref:balbiani ring protein 3-like n=1 Tax=Pollicipes pollicipes TaxID=41117 RepID=UPI001884D1DD|nr:balbiani ring protein 3-like [Pollicipes pollicipes]
MVPGSILLIVSLTASVAALYGPGARPPDMADMESLMNAMSAMEPAERHDMMSEAGRRAGAVAVAVNLTTEEPRQCSKTDTRSVSGLLVSCRCRPRLTAVHLEHSQGLSQISPWVVVVKRCSGWCGHPTHSCMPRTVREKPITVVSFSSRIMGCSTLYVQEDVDCRCGCLVQETDCNPLIQRYDRRSCRCRCRGPPLECAHNQLWDPRTCRCACLRILHCSTGYGWSEQHCRCMMLMSADDTAEDATVNEIATT